MPTFNLLVQEVRGYGEVRVRLLRKGEDAEWRAQEELVATNPGLYSVEVEAPDRRGLTHCQPRIVGETSSGTWVRFRAWLDIRD